MTREHHYRLDLAWVGAEHGPTSSYQSYSREYLITIEGKPTLRGSADPVFRGDASLHNPEDLLVAALASCHMLSFLALASRAGLSILTYTDAAEGTMTFEAGQGQFSAVALHPCVVVAAGTDTNVVRRLHEEAHEACFIARSVNFPVTHEAIVEFDEGT
jgi:organic hydroperoxide reductase OsmC/OhrA